MAVLRPQRGGLRACLSDRVRPVGRQGAGKPFASAVLAVHGGAGCRQDGGAVLGTIPAVGQLLTEVALREPGHACLEPGPRGPAAPCGPLVRASRGLRELCARVRRGEPLLGVHLKQNDPKGK